MNLIHSKRTQYTSRETDVRSTGYSKLGLLTVHTEVLVIKNTRRYVPFFIGPLISLFIEIQFIPYRNVLVIIAIKFQHSFFHCPSSTFSRTAQEKDSLRQFENL